MSLNKILEDLKKLKNVYYETTEVTLGKELKITVQLLTSEEETDVHAKAMSYDQGLAYLYAVKRETLSRSIVAINGNKIPETIDDLNEKGEPEKLERYAWIRKNIIGGWNQVLIDYAWEGYAKLLTNLEKTNKM